MGGANANSTYFYTYLEAPLGLWSCDPLASSYDYGGQNLMHSAYEAH